MGITRYLQNAKCQPVVIDMCLVPCIYRHILKKYLSYCQSQMDTVITESFINV